MSIWLNSTWAGIAVADLFSKTGVNVKISNITSSIVIMVKIMVFGQIICNLFWELGFSFVIVFLLTLTPHYIVIYNSHDLYKLS
ncbi:MAG: hypothetical protein FWF27_02560, partial [Candidatus Bathyarchaeota archaeon]|nr:hypothetical protein [Candidatus Termiticorpusculum sp.]